MPCSGSRREPASRPVPTSATPKARAAGIAGLEIVVDTREQYGYRFSSQQATTVKKALPCGDYGIEIAGQLVAAVERKSLADLVSSMINGKLRYALGELAALGRAAVVVEDRYSSVFKLDRVRPAVIADGLAELAVRWPAVPIVFAETRQLAEEWTYRYLAAAHAWVLDDLAVSADVNLAAEAEPAAPREVGPVQCGGAFLGSKRRPRRARQGPASARNLASMA